MKTWTPFTKPEWWTGYIFRGISKEGGFDRGKDVRYQNLLFKGRSNLTKQVLPTRDWRSTKMTGLPLFLVVSKLVVMEKLLLHEKRT